MTKSDHQKRKNGMMKNGEINCAKIVNSLQKVDPPPKSFDIIFAPGDRGGGSTLQIFYEKLTIGGVGMFEQQVKNRRWHR